MNEILSKLKKIDFKIFKLSNNIFNGKYRSIFKGNGIEFLDYSKYEYGDDTKYIDWKVSLRKGNLYKKNFVEDRNINILLVIDTSSSMSFLNKMEIALNFCYFISHLAFKNNDKLSIITFNNKVDYYLKSKNNRNDFFKILDNLSKLKIKNNSKTNIKNCLSFINKMIKKRAVIFLISDFISNFDYEEEIKICKNKHDFISVVIDIEEENILKNFGLIEVYNPEENKYTLIDTSLYKEFNLYSQKNKKKLINFFNKNSIDHIFLNKENFILELTNFFNFRKRKY